MIKIKTLTVWVEDDATEQDVIDELLSAWYPPEDKESAEFLHGYTCVPITITLTAEFQEPTDGPDGK